MVRRATWMTGCALGAIVSSAGSLAAQAGWVPLQWTDAAGRWQAVEYDRGSLRRSGEMVVVTIRRDRESALRQDSVISPGTHPWTRQELEFDCAVANWRVVRWEARDETGRLLASGGGDRWSSIRSRGYPRALELRLCPWR